jgi:hypothetical protein
MPKSSDPEIVKQLEYLAKYRARTKRATGYATNGNVGVRYYPTCDRYAWFNESGPISKWTALQLLKPKKLSA